jgi:hypothetical protein
VDKFAFNTEINADPFTLKRFTNGAACVKWLGKRLNPGRPYDGEAIVLVVKCPEVEVVWKFLDEFAGVSPLVPEVVMYGAEDSECAVADSCISLDDAMVKAKALITARAPMASVSMASASQECPIDDVEGLVWIAEEAGLACGGASRARGFASAQKAISWLERQMKLCHDSCAACSPKRRCPQCNKAYKCKSATKQLPWVGDKLRTLVVAHHAPALEAYLGQFPQNCGPMIDVVVYSHKAEDGFLSFGEAVQTLRDLADGREVSAPLAATLYRNGVPAEYGRGGVGYGSAESGASRETPSTKSGLSPPSSEAAGASADRSRSDSFDSNDSDSRSDESFDSEMSKTRRTDLDDLRALTPVPEDSELPWLFLDTIRAAQTDTLRLAGRLSLNVEDFQPGLREKLHVRTYDAVPTSGTGAPVSPSTFQSSCFSPTPQSSSGYAVAPTPQSSSSFAVSPTPGYSGMQTGTNFTSSTSFFGGGLQQPVSQSPPIPSSLPPNSSLPPSSSFQLPSGMGFMPEMVAQNQNPFQPGYIGNPLHPGDQTYIGNPLHPGNFDWPNSM